MSTRKFVIVLLLLLFTVLAACGTSDTGTDTEETDGTVLPESSDEAEAATASARTKLADQLGIAEDEIEVVSVQAAEFMDSCLGLGQANESCLQAITPGWVVMLRAAGQEYEVHTDQTSQQVRVAMEIPEVDNSSDEITGAAQEFLAAELGVSLGDVEVISVVETEFTDSCLGLGKANESCLQATTPGWLVMLRAAGQEYEVRTDLTGQQVRVAIEIPEADNSSDEIAGAAQEFLADELGVSLGDVEVISVEETEFTDSCLGLGKANESCLQVITPGWLVVLSGPGQEYEVRTDQMGEQVRLAVELD